MPAAVVPSGVMLPMFRVAVVFSVRMFGIINRLRIISRSRHADHGRRDIHHARRRTIRRCHIHGGRMADDDASREWKGRHRQSESDVHIDTCLGCDSGSEKNG